MPWIRAKGGSYSKSLTQHTDEQSEEYVREISAPLIRLLHTAGSVSNLFLVIHLPGG